MEKIKIESLLKQLETINKKYDEIDKITGRNFNIFDAGNIGHIETFHTRLIAELLSPNGSHNQKDKFLKIFLDTLGFKKIKLTKPESHSEFVIENNRRIDILIKDESFIIGIEAKVYANDGNKQLKDYYEFLKKKNKYFKLYYLTLDGHLPDEKSLDDLKIDKDIFIISFGDEIYDWINRCIKEVSDIPVIREGLYQYKLLLEKLTNKNIQKEEEVKEVIGKDSESIKAANEIFKNYPVVWYEKELEFWVDLYNYLHDKYFQGWEDGDKDIYNIWYDEKGNEYPEEIIINNLKNTTNNDARGICLKKTINGKKVYVGVDYGNYDENVSLWYSGIDKELNGFKYFEGDDENIDFYSKYANTELKFYPNNKLSFEIFDKKEFDNKKKELAKELNELKEKVLEE